MIPSAICRGAWVINPRCVPLSVQAFKYKVTCPPWALPAEEVPIHVQFDKSITPLLQSVNVSLHESLVFRDFINMAGRECDGRMLTVSSIGKSTMSDYDYFGFAVATTSPFEELKRTVPIKIKFNYHDGTSETYTEHARIFRPLLELDASPDRITITDRNEGRLELPIAMRFSGFGQIKVRAECRIEGRIVSFASSMLNEMLRKIVREGTMPDEAGGGAGVSVDPDYVERTVTEVGVMLQNRDGLGNVLDDLRGGTHADALRGLSRESKEKFVGMLYNTAEAYVGQIIAEILDRNVGANITMEPTKIHAQISLPVTRATVRLFYRDLVGNVYGPVEKQVEIVDKRKMPAGIGVKIPLSIKSVDESRAYKNVSAMEIDAGEQRPSARGPRCDYWVVRESPRTAKRLQARG